MIYKSAYPQLELLKFNGVIILAIHSVFIHLSQYYENCLQFT